MPKFTDASQSFDFPKISLTFQIFTQHEDEVHVRSSLEYVKNNTKSKQNLELFGIGLEAKEVSLDGVKLKPEEYSIQTAADGSQTLSIPKAKDKGTVEVSNILRPKENNANDGLYIVDDYLFANCGTKGTMPIAFSPSLNNFASYKTTIYYTGGELRVSGDEISNDAIETDKNKDIICRKYLETHKIPSTAFRMIVNPQGFSGPDNIFLDNKDGNEIECNIEYPTQDRYIDGDSDGDNSLSYERKLLESIMQQAFETAKNEFNHSYPYKSCEIIGLKSKFVPETNELMSNLSIFDLKFLLAMSQSNTVAEITKVASTISKPFFYNGRNGEYNIAANWQHSTFMYNLLGPAARMHEMRAIRNKLNNHTFTKEFKFEQFFVS